jgi:ABC-type phosphate transport system auxiliary subunit
MPNFEIARKIEEVNNLDSMSNEELNGEEARLQARRLVLQEEIESVVEELKGISEEKFKRNTTGK